MKNAYISPSHTIIQQLAFEDLLGIRGAVDKEMNKAFSNPTELIVDE